MARIVAVGANLAKRKVLRGIRETEAEDHAVQAVGDIVDVFEDSWVFSPSEHIVFDFIEVQGLTKKQVKAALPQFEYREIGNVEQWKESTDLSWKVLDDEPKFKLSTVDLTTQNKTDMASVLTSRSEKEDILGTIKNRVLDSPGNTVEA